MVATATCCKTFVLPTQNNQFFTQSNETIKKHAYFFVQLGQTLFAFLRLKFKFRRGSLPPMMPLEFIGCIGGCDETLREVLDLKYLRAGGGGGGSAGGGQGGGGGGGHDPHPPPPRPPRALNLNPRPSVPPVPSWTTQPRPPPGGSGANSDVIVCNCGQEALLLTVRKDGPNQGRQFYKCNAGSCNFFLWADQPSQQGALPAQRTLQPPRPSLGNRNTLGGGRGREAGDHEQEIMCKCDEVAVTRTVQKDGPNKGRTFHTCGKPREQQCGFFQWADENMPPPGTSQ